MNFLHNYDIGNQDPKGTRSGGVGWRGCGSICGYKVVEINTLNFKRVQELCVSRGRPGEQVIYMSFASRNSQIDSIFTCQVDTIRGYAWKSYTIIIFIQDSDRDESF